MVGGVAFLLRQTEAGGAIFANMIVIQSVKKRQTEELANEYVQKGANNLYQYCFHHKNQKICVDAQTESGRISI
jgi:hypothetical protein